MEIKVDIQGSTSILMVKGNVTMQTAHKLLESIKNNSKSVSLLISFAEVDYMDSSGVGVLVSGLRFAKEQNIKLGLVHLAGKVKMVMEMSGLCALFSIYPDIPTAVSQMA